MHGAVVRRLSAGGCTVDTLRFGYRGMKSAWKAHYPQYTYVGDIVV